ncbi:hypothetical protein [Ottowia testudinis]|uniref:Uncharacterized protein n=1 Tax=Ottowia testudinis TaxID=2816950 RepID=A0A975H3D5_9BURK|nr:hypothetical protein [Ottowia testudinis]QTD45121.1 hypothetical protein J1M35_19190 [Ottowia testudinis]
MNRTLPRHAYWPLDYGWSQRGGPWSELTDVMLIAQTQGDEGTAQALADWVARQGSEPAEVDGCVRDVFYAGGVRGYLDKTDAGATLYLHSHGEDAFDSLSHYSRQIAKLVQSRGGMPLTWTEARHDRADHQLSWP